MLTTTPESLSSMSNMTTTPPDAMEAIRMIFDLLVTHTSQHQQQPQLQHYEQSMGQQHHQVVLDTLDYDINYYQRQLVFNDSFTFSQRNFSSPDIAYDFASTSRFGHSNDFVSLLGSEEEQSDYLYGLVWMGSIVAGFFTLWLLFIMLFWLLGKRKVGFLSGQPFERTYYYVSSNNVNRKSTTNSQVPFTPTNKPTMGTSSDDGEDCYIEDSPSKPRTPRSTRSSNNNNNISNLNDSYAGESTGASMTSSPAYHQTKTNSNCTLCGIDSANWVRIVFVTSGIIFILFSILLVLLGLTNLQSAVDDLNESSTSVAEVTSEARETVRLGLLAVQNNAKNISNTLQTELQLDNFCPANPILSGLTESDKIQNLAADGIEYLKILDEYANSDDLDTLLVALESSESSAQDVADATADIDISDWESLVILIVGTVIPSMLVVSAIMAGYGATNGFFQCTVWWFFFPLFVVMTIVAAVMSAAMLIGATVNSDFCYPTQYTSTSDSTTTTPASLFIDPSMLADRLENSIAFNPPDFTVLQVLQKEGINKDSFEYQIASFYITQCTALNPIEYVEDYPPELESARKKLLELKQYVNNTEIIDELTAVCNRSFDQLLGSLSLMDDLVRDLLKALQNIIKLIRCDNLVPIYQNTFYDATCDYAIKANIWLFSSTLILAVFGFLMIMFRSSLSETVFTYMYDGGERKVSAFHDENEVDGDKLNDNDYDNDGVTRGGDTVLKSIEDYEKNMHSKSTPY